MAVLTNAQLGELMRAIDRIAAQRGTTITFTETQLNATLQAVEDWFEGQRSAINTAINQATGGNVIPAGLKALIVKQYLQQKFNRE